MWKKKLLWLGIFAIAVIYGLHSCTSTNSDDLGNVAVPPPKPRENLIVISSDIITQLDSSRTVQQSTMNVLNQIQEGLVRLNEKGEIVPALASHYTVDSENKVFTFQIREGAKWSDGKPIQAEDFRYAWLRAIHPESEFAYPNLFYSIENAENYKLGKVNEDEVGIKILENNRIQIKLNQSNANFPVILINTAFSPLRKDIIQQYQENYGTSPETMVFSGPFKLKAFSSESVTLVPNEQYWDRENVKVNEVKINVEQDESHYPRIYNTNKADIIKVTGEIYSTSQRKDNLKQVILSDIHFLQINHQDSILKNRNVRFAIMQSIDRNLFLNLSQSYIIPTYYITKREQSNNFTEKDIQSAFDKGLKELGMNSEEIELTILVENNSKEKRIAQNIADQLTEKFNIRTGIKELTVLKQFREEEKGAFDLSLTSWLFYDKSMSLKIWHSEYAGNTAKYNNPKFDQLIDQAKQEPDPTKQLALLQEAEQILIDQDAGVIPLYFSGNSWLQKPRVKGVVYHSFGPEYTLKWAELEPVKK